MARQQRPKHWRSRVCVAFAVLLALSLFILGLDQFEMWLIILAIGYAYWLLKMD